MKIFFLLSVIALSSFSALARQKGRECADTVNELRMLVGNSDFPTSWIETGGNDGMPLTMTISEKSGQLFLDFNKKDKGMFIQATGTICKDGNKYVSNVKGSDIEWGPGADGFIRGLIGNGDAKVTIELPYTNQMEVKISKGFLGADLKFGVK